MTTAATEKVSCAASFTRELPAWELINWLVGYTRDYEVAGRLAAYNVREVCREAIVADALARLHKYCDDLTAEDVKHLFWYINHEIEKAPYGRYGQLRTFDSEEKNASWKDLFQVDLTIPYSFVLLKVIAATKFWWGKVAGMVDYKVSNDVYPYDSRRRSVSAEALKELEKMGWYVMKKRDFTARYSNPEGGCCIDAKGVVLRLRDVR